MATTFDQTSPDKLRAAIIARLGIDPTKLTAFGGNPTFDAQITSLYQDALNKMAGYDTQSARLGQDYEQNLSNLNRQRDLSSANLMGTLANRGLSYSGAALTQQAAQAEDYGQRLQQLNQTKNRGMEDLGAAQNNVLYGVLSGRGTYEGQYTQNLQDFLNQQAQAAAAQQINQPIPAAAAPRPIVKAPTIKKPTVSSVTRKVAPQITVKASGRTGGQTGFKTPGGVVGF